MDLYSSHVGDVQFSPSFGKYILVLPYTFYQVNAGVQLNESLLNKKGKEKKNFFFCFIKLSL